MLAAVLAVAACVWAPVSTWASAGTAAVGEGGLLFAELDAAFSFQKVDLANIESELVGIIVDGEDFGTELVYRQGDHYYLPTSLLTQMSVQGTARAGALYLSTPGGEVEAGTEYFREIFGAMFFRADLLDEVLRIRWEFLPES